MNRVTYDEKGELDEIVTDAGCHLERMSKKNWFLCCYREDGTSVALWIKGKVCSFEERDPGEFWRLQQEVLAAADITYRQDMVARLREIVDRYDME